MKKWLKILLIVLGVLIIVAIGLLIYGKLIAAQNSNRLSSHQKVIIGNLNWPDHFVKMYSHEEGIQTIEIWYYEYYGYKFTFADGVLTGKEKIANPSSDTFVDIKPYEFTGKENEAYFISHFGEAQVAENEGRRILSFNNELAAVFKDDQLVAVATAARNQNAADHVGIISKALAYERVNMGTEQPGPWEKFKRWLEENTFWGRTKKIVERPNRDPWDEIGNDTLDDTVVDNAVKFRTEDFPTYAVEAGKEAVDKVAGDASDIVNAIENTKKYFTYYTENKKAPIDPKTTAEEIQKEKPARDSSSGQTQPSSSPTSQARQIHGTGIWSEGDCHGTIQLNFSSGGGAVEGSFTGPCYAQKGVEVGSCKGGISGTFAGGDGGSIHGSIGGSCNIGGVTHGGNGAWSGTIQLSAGTGGGAFGVTDYGGGTWNLEFRSVQ